MGYFPDVAVPGFVYDKDQEFEELKSKLLDLSTRAPSLSRRNKAALRALCQDLNILYSSKDTKKVLSDRLLLYRQENGAHDDEYSAQAAQAAELRSAKLKRHFEEDELSRATLMSWPHRQLEQLCREYKIPPFNSSNPRPLKKEDMARKLLLWASRYVSAYENALNSVIGKDLLEEVWADMARSILPSWIQPAPPKWGIPATGKLSADEYKVVCSISLVITLIRVWGYGNKERPQSRHYRMLLNFLDLVRSIHVIFLHETSQGSRAYYQGTMLKYLEGVLELFPDAMLSSNHHLALHIVTDLENMGPGHARSTPVFERVNHALQEIRKNGRVGEVEATMMTSYGRMANLQILLDRFPDLQEEVEEALAVLEDIEREDHRGMFAGTDLSAWSSTKFKETPIFIDEAALDRIMNRLCETYQVGRLHWNGKVTRSAQQLDGVALGRVIYSSRLRENSIVFRSEGNIVAGTIAKVFRHSHPHPVTQETVSTTYLEVSPMQPITEGQDDLYRVLNCGWLCSQSNTARRTLTVPLGDVVSHFVRTDLTLLVNDTAVTHVYPVPKVNLNELLQLDPTDVLNA
ncbi:hypothetical protein EV360DRAFT_88492 [Lentinula raphanica]|nr:hypothetical protein EV360DRAFT_88492 [Lentinula raphanica]